MGNDVPRTCNCRLLGAVARWLPNGKIDPMIRNLKKRLPAIYDKLLAYHGVQNWWHSDSKWEIMVGAVLTQNTSWQNVAMALANLKRENVLAPLPMHTMDMGRLGELIRSAGFVTSKPHRLKRLAQFLINEYGGDTNNLRGGDLQKQRAQLLAINGIGPETADAILLYVAEQPIFVIDAYTRRIFYRLGWVEENVSYADLQRLFMDNLPPDVAYFNEFHALLDVHCKRICTKRAPKCSICPLRRICAKRGVGTTNNQ